LGPGFPQDRAFLNPARQESFMRRQLRKSMPFILAIFFGTMAGIVVASVAFLASHS
jgi:hypothetical protein